MADDDNTYTEGNLGTEIPQQIRPRDQQGKFVRESRNPEPLFAAREIEGPMTPYTEDDLRYAEHERNVADGRDEGQGRQPAKNRQDVRRTGDDAEDDESESDIEQIGEHANELEELQSEDGEEKYEVTVEGNVIHVSFGELKRGYVRQHTYDQWTSQLQKVRNEIEDDYTRLQANWQNWHKAREALEQEIMTSLPKEPDDWDAEYRKDPTAAHNLEKIYKAIYGKVAASRQARADQAVADEQERDRRVRRFAIDGFNQFVADNKLEDQSVRDKEVRSMRRTAQDAGFSEQEIASTYDPRMLKVLLWASTYRRWSANRPKAVQPGKSKTLTPGAAAPLGSVRRNGSDEAQRQLAKSGRIDDAAEWFRRSL